MTVTTSRLIFFLIVGAAVLIVGFAALLMPLLYYRFGPPDLEATAAAVAIRATEVSLDATEAAVAATKAAATPGADEVTSERGDGSDELTWDGLKIAVVAVNRDAWPLVHVQNENNEPPLPGRTMLMVTVEVTNVAGPQEAPVAISSADFNLIGDRRTLYTTYGEETACGVIPDELDGVVARQSYPMTGNICFQVPLDEQGFQLVYEQYTGDYPAVYFELPEPELGR
jgi:hypothetical protein